MLECIILKNFTSNYKMWKKIFKHKGGAIALQVTDVRPVQPLKPPIVFRDSGNDMDVRPVQPEKAPLSIVSRDSGNDMDVRLVQPQKVHHPIVSRDSGSITEVKLVQPSKAP